MCTRMSSDEIEKLGLPDDGSLEVDIDYVEVLHLSNEDTLDKGSLLHTLGLGPCIAFIARGTVKGNSDDDELSPYFIALYHWSGDSLTYDSTESDKDSYFLKVTQNAIRFFLSEIRAQIGPDYDISINELHFIGGQKNSAKPDDNTGTEAQVHAIRTLIPDISKINHTSIKLENTCDISTHFFEATEEESIDVFVNHHNISYVVYETVYEDLDFSQAFSDDDSAEDLVLPKTSSDNYNASAAEPTLSTFFPIHSPKTRKHPREEISAADPRPEKIRKTP